MFSNSLNQLKNAMQRFADSKGIVEALPSSEGMFDFDAILALL